MGGFAIILIAVFYNVIANQYFGGNALPESDAEVISDGITLLILAIGILTLQIWMKKS